MVSKNQIKFVRSLELKKNRKREGLFVAEGPKVVEELLRANYQIHSIYMTASRIEDSRFCRLPHTTIATEDELRRISFLQHPQEILGVFYIPNNTDSTSNNELFSTLSLALDGVQDPGNVGTIIRIADWFGINTIYCSLDTADVYNPKVVQATMGSLAHVQIKYCDLENLFLQTTCPIYGTLLDGENIYELSLTSNGIIVMGNEGSGISPAIRQLITNKLLIPNYHTDGATAESLNVAIATAITCAEFRRQSTLLK